MPHGVIARLRAYASMPVLTGIERTRKSVRDRFLAMGIELNFATTSILARYTERDYEAFCQRLGSLPRPLPFERIFVDGADKVRGFDFKSIPDSFFNRQTRGFILDLTNLRLKHSLFLQEKERLLPAMNLANSGRVPISSVGNDRTFKILISRASKLLTGDLLFNPQSGAAYPRNAEEYHEIMRKLLDEKGRFPGDPEALTKEGTFSPPVRGTSHVSLRRRGITFRVEVFSPRLHAQGVKNRLIFDADLIAQGASFDAYGTAGVSYDRESYYVRRLFNAEKDPFIRVEGWPVSFAAMQGYQMAFDGEDLYYAFIHFVMTRGLFQGYGLTSYSVREGMSSLFYSDVWHNNPNLMFDSKGNLRDYRLRMWAAAHSGRFAPFYAFVKSFGGIDPCWEPIAQAIFQDVHRRIAPPVDELESRRNPVTRGAAKVNGGWFPVALDRGVYPPHTRYPLKKKGEIDFPQSEINLPSSVRDVWLKTIGGNEGVAAGNGLYFGGLVTIGKIREAKRKEEQREGGWVERLGDRLRSWIIRDTK